MPKETSKPITKPKKSKIVPVEPASIFERFELADLANIMNTSETTNYVWVNLKLTDWEYADFTVCVRASSTISVIRRHILDRHGHAPRLQIFRPPVNKKNEIMDFSLTLENIGIMGGPKEACMTGTLYYSFKPIKGDPIVLREPGMYLSDDPFASEGSTGMGSRSRADANPL
jgi:hypothetical protein